MHLNFFQTNARNVSYSAAVLDPKRRQGFLRALADFKSAYSGIQKKHALLNNNRRSGNKCNNLDMKLPLLISSGQRMDYTRGSGDEGPLALRSPDDVSCLVRHLAGLETHGGSDESVSGDGDLDGKKNGQKKKMLPRRTFTSPAERLLSRAADRAMGVVSVSNRGRKSRSFVMGAVVVGKDAAKSNGTNSDNGDGDEDEASATLR